MKKIFTWVLLGFSLSAFAEETKTVKLEEIRLRVRKVGSFMVEPSTAPGAAVIKFSLTHSNSCIAANQQIIPLTTVEALPEGHGSLEYFVRVMVNEKMNSNVSCPRIYMPVEVNYVVTVRNLKSGADHLVEVEGTESRGLVHIN